MGSVVGRPSAVRQLRGHTMDGGESRRQPKKQQKLSRNCSVCSGPAASHVHYGAVSCYSCRAFFRRGIGKPYCCVEGKGDCTIDFTSRRSCQWCRFDKCLRVGMRQDLVDATLRKKNLSGDSLEGREPDSSNTLIPSFQSIEQHDVLAQVLLEIDKGVELPVEYQVVGEYREVDLLGDELQFSLVSLLPPLLTSTASSHQAAAVAAREALLSFILELRLPRNLEVSLSCTAMPAPLQTQTHQNHLLELPRRQLTLKVLWTNAFLRR